MKQKGEIGRWLERKYIAWLSERGQVLPLDEFAKFLGINPATFNRYYNGSRKRIDYQIAKQIAQKLQDYEIMDILGYERPGDDELLEGFPPEFRAVFTAALNEARDELVKRGITEGSEEARSIINTAFARHGLNITFTEPQPD